MLFFYKLTPVSSMQGPDFIDMIIRLQDNRIEDQRCDISTFSKVSCFISGVLI